MSDEDGVSPEARVGVTLELDGAERLDGESIPSARVRKQIGDGVLLECSLCLSSVPLSKSLSALYMLFCPYRYPHPYAQSRNEDGKFCVADTAHNFTIPSYNIFCLSPPNSNKMFTLIICTGCNGSAYVKNQEFVLCKNEQGYA